jgi:hypothetical protein
MSRVLRPVINNMSLDLLVRIALGVRFAPVGDLGPQG